MMAFLSIALRSAWARRSTLALVVFSVALSTLLLLGVERIRSDVRENFAQSVSGTDLVVGARTGAVQLMLYSVFRVGGATNNVRMKSLQDLAQNRSVAWMVPLSLGDSHHGYPVLATTPDYFTRFLYGDRQPLVLAEGRSFDGTLDGLYDCVLGAEVAKALGYQLGQHIVLSHGTGTIPGAEHADKPFTVAGILARTGTPVDRTVHISLEAMTAIHLDWVAGAQLPGFHVSAEDARKADLRPKEVTAALIGLKNRAAVFAVQRAVNDYEGEPLMAVLPGVALDELWQAVGVGEKALLGMSALVAVVSLVGLVAVVLAGLGERRRELAVLRAVGASPRHVLWLLAAEGAGVTLLGAAIGTLATGLFIALATPWLQAQFGITLSADPPSAAQWGLLAAIVVAGFVASLLPGWRAYRLSLADGLSPKV
jgi:putative ABC transport system permease protein